MPILYLHGVSIRDDTGWEELESILRRYVAPEIASDPENVMIERCYWGDFGAKFRWAGASTPNSPIKEIVQDGLTSAKTNSAKFERLAEISKFFAEKTKATAQKSKEDIGFLRLKDFNHQNLSDFYARLISQNSIWSSPKQKSIALVAADEVANEPSTWEQLKQCATFDDELALLEKLVKQRCEKLGLQVGSRTIKFPDLTKSVTHDIFEGLARAAHLTGFAVTRAAAEVRNPLNQFVTMFIGDVFTYLYNRGDYRAPGQIPLIVLESLSKCHENKQERGAEPLILFSHSMGGQITYDLVTHFIEKMPEFSEMRIDFWCASASQVGLFEELKLFIESSEEYGSEFGNEVPFPSRQHLGYWWNVWDHNDFVSYSAKGIIQGVDDETYNTGMFMVNAHEGYLVLPSFYRRFAKKLAKAKAAHWMQPVGVNST